MKHIFITLLCISGIVFYTVFSCRYISDFSHQVLAELPGISNTNHNHSSVENIKEIYDDKKNVLLFLVNKEHLDEVENVITELEFSVKYDNEQQTSTCQQQLENIIDEIKRASHTLY